MIGLCTYSKPCPDAKKLYDVGWHEIYLRPALFRFSLVGQDAVDG